jgi:hypothetical protein
VQKQRLVELGIQENNIRIHPDNVQEKGKEEAAAEYAMKLLGTWIVCARKLDQKLAVLREEAERLKGFSDLQTMYLLLSNCYCHNVNYLMRTTPYRLMESFLTGNEELKMGVFAKLFVNAYPDGTLPEDLKMQAQARNQDGGFNLSNSLKITHAAYVASVVEFLSTVKACFPAFDPDEYLDFRASTAEIQSWAPTAEEREEIFDVTKLRSMLGDKKKKQSLQGQLSTNWHQEIRLVCEHQWR